EAHLSASAPSVPGEISIALNRLPTNRVRPTGLLRRLRAAQTLNSFEASRDRQPAHGHPSGSWQGGQRSLRDAFTEAVGSTPDLLENDPSERLVVSWRATRGADLAVRRRARLQGSP